MGGHDPASPVPLPTRTADVVGDAADWRPRALRLVSLLCREIARTDPSVGLGLRDATPRLELQSVTGVVVDVRVDDDCADFVLRPSFRRCSTSDIAEAARMALRSLRMCENRPGGEAG